LGAFAGIRPTEILRLTWADVNLEAKTVRIPAVASKTRAARTVELEPNAVAWLELDKSEGPIFKGNVARLIERLRLAAGLEGWVQDFFRHSFATYHTTAFQNPGKTAMMLHSKDRPDTLFRHYFSDRLKSDAIRYWNIYPK
jgi:integrase